MKKFHNQVQSDVMWYPTSGKLRFGKITENYGNAELQQITADYNTLWQIMVDYSRSQRFTAFYSILHFSMCFIEF